MISLTLIKQDHMDPDYDYMTAALEDLKAFLQEDVDLSDDDWVAGFIQILQFQDPNGGFSLLDSDILRRKDRDEFCLKPTYLCAAILMKTYMFNHRILVGRERMFVRALIACCDGSFSGFGYDVAYSLEVLSIFKEAGLREFLMYHSDLCPSFSELIQDFADSLKDREEFGFFAGFGEKGHDEEIRKMNEYFADNIVFVYGKLMSGQRNEIFLSKTLNLGLGTISGFDMYEVEDEPVIFPGDGNVKGELHRITKSDLAGLDSFMLNGSRFYRRCVPAVDWFGEVILAHVYVFTDNICTTYPRILECFQPYTENWKDRRNNYVWYVSYGSNMLRERFMCYIKGGCFKGSTKKHEPCADTSDPLEVRTFDIPYGMYFGNQSKSWDGKGVAFLDYNGGHENGYHALGVAYLITSEQFVHVARQENSGREPYMCPNWYNLIAQVGNMDGIRVVTVTNSGLREYNPPSDAYLATLFRGIEENYPDMSKEEIADYLRRCIR